jgi:hypothetical protein
VPTMNIEYATGELERLAKDRHYCGSIDLHVVVEYRGLVQALSACAGTDDLRKVDWLGLADLDSKFPTERDVHLCDGYRSTLLINERSVTVVRLTYCSERGA